MPGIEFTFESKYSSLDQVKFIEDNLYEIWRDMVCLSRLYSFKFFKGSLSQILLGPFLNTLSHLMYNSLDTDMKIFVNMD